MMEQTLTANVTFHSKSFLSSFSHWFSDKHRIIKSTSQLQAQQTCLMVSTKLLNFAFTTMIGSCCQSIVKILSFYCNCCEHQGRWRWWWWKLRRMSTTKVWNKNGCWITSTSSQPRIQPLKHQKNNNHTQKWYKTTRFQSFSHDTALLVWLLAYMLLMAWLFQ